MVGEIRDARDGADRDRGGADRPHDADHPAHQRRPRRDRAPQRDGHRDLPDRLGGRLRGRPAARPQALLRTASGGRCIPARRWLEAGVRGRRRHRGLRAGRLRPLQQQRLPRPGRHLLGDEPQRTAQRDDDRPRSPSRKSPPSPAKRECSPCARTASPRSAPATPASRRYSVSLPDFDFSEVLGRMVETQRLRRPPHARLPAGDARQGQDPADGGLPGRSTAQQTREVVYGILNDDQRKRFENNQQLDFAYAIPGVARFRVNCFFQRGSVSAAFRLVPQEIPALDSLGVPQVLRELTEKPRGFVLVTGPTGSGKSTTLAAMIDVINSERPGPHPHDRGPDRVPAPAQKLDRQPARDRLRRARLRARPARRAARGPRRDPGRRDARPGDDLAPR